MSSALKGVTAAVVDVVPNLAVWLSFHVLFAGTRPFELAGVFVEWAVLKSQRGMSLLLTLIAAVAAFRFAISVGTTLTITGTLGVLAVLVGATVG